MRPTILALLACLTLAANLAAGYARGQSDPAGQIVLCTGHGPVMVYLDETGAPTGPPVLCPDGIAQLFDLAATLAVPPAPGWRASTLAPPASSGIPPHTAPIEGKARSPPRAA